MPQVVIEPFVPCSGVREPRAGWLCELRDGHEGDHSAFVGGGSPMFWPNVPPTPRYGWNGFEVCDRWGMNRCSVQAQRYVNEHGVERQCGQSCERIAGHEGQHGSNISQVEPDPWFPPFLFDAPVTIPDPNRIGYTFSYDGAFHESYCVACAAEYMGIDENLNPNTDWRDAQGDPPLPVRPGHDDWCDGDEGDNELTCRDCDRTLVLCFHEELCPCGDGCALGDCGNCDDDSYDRDYDGPSDGRGCACDDCKAMEAWSPGDDE